jgi:quercetin dioxygenase-like cupin family protein
MMNPTVTIRSADAAEQRWFCGGGRHTWLATEEETQGAFLLFEDALEQGKDTPLHRHDHSDETFYMLSGEILLDVDGDRRTIGAGGIAIIPRGIPHAFTVTSSEAKMLCLQTPGGGERFYRLASEPVIARQPATPLDFGRVQRAAGETGAIEILGPSPF